MPNSKQPINYCDNTHALSSIHQSVSASAIRLNERYEKEILRPCYLFQTKNSDEINVDYFLITNSSKQLWIKFAYSDWKAVKIDELKDTKGLREKEYKFLYKFSGKIYNKLFIPEIPFNQINQKTSFLKLPYVEGENSGIYFTEDLDEILLSQQILTKIGITRYLKLDLTNIPESYTPEQYAAKVDEQKQQLQARRSIYKPKSDWFDRFQARRSIYKPKSDWFDRFIEETSRSNTRRKLQTRPRLTNSIFSQKPVTSGHEAPTSEKLGKEVNKLTM